ncbi:unnamed protein product [Blepharisma stoltei]|uniref:Uncharacterized protein n=1 Tax=Blepharisma stoltei TaxID=1481888 RepID=A0AAU9KCL7_9CILI|nr:unnamed protein product [Blepharisma stoltei]
MEKCSHSHFTFFFFFLTFFLSSCGTIVQLNDLSEIRVSQNSNEYLLLDYFFAGPNLTYELSGSYLNNLQSPIPSISQRMTLYSSFQKAASNLPPNNFQLIQQNAVYRNIIYTLEGQLLSFWDISDLMSIKLLSAQAISGGKLLGFYQIYDSVNSGFMILQNISNGYLVSFYNETEPYKVSLVAGLQITIETDMELTGFSVYPIFNDIFTFILVKSQIYVIKFNPQNSTASIYYIFNSTSLQANSFSPIYFYYDSLNGYICDAENGVFALNLGNFFSEAIMTFNVNLLLRIPLSLGEIYSCTCNSQNLFVGTSQGIVDYKVPDMTFAQEYDRDLEKYENLELEGLSRLESVWNRISGYFTSNISTNFRIYNPTETYYGHLALSEYTTNLFGTEALLCETPPYTWIDGLPFFIFSTPNYLYVYQYNLPAMTTVAINNNYTFVGNLKVSNSKDEIIVPVTIYATDPTSMEIYNWRGLYLGNGYQQPYQINLYASIRIEENSGELYLPLSNYFSGQNISYSLSPFQQTDSGNITVINPPKYLLASSISVTPKLSFSPVLIMSENNFIQLLVAIPTDSAESYVFSFDNNGIPTLSHQISCTNSSMTSSNGVTFVYYIRYLIIECIFQDPSTGVYDVDWDIYTFETSYEYKYLRTHKWFQILNSAKIISLCMWNIAALRGDQVEIYSLNATDTTLTALPSINTNSIIGIPQFMPIDIATIYPGSCWSLYAYDFDAGLIWMNLTSFQAPYQVTVLGIAGSVKDIYTKITYANNKIYIISPQSEASNSFVAAEIPFHYTISGLEYLPIFPECIYTSISADYRFVAVLCENIKSNQIMIFDSFDFTFENLYAAVPISRVGSACIFYSNSIALLYVYEGESLQTYVLAQSVDNFMPPSSSSLLPSYSQTEVVWAKIEFNFTSPVTEEQTFDFMLTAENGYRNKTTIISIDLVPRGTVVLANADFDLSSSNLTSGNTIEVLKTQITENVPLQAVKGNNIKFGVFDTKKDDLMMDEQDCSAVSPICIASKYNLNEAIWQNHSSYDSCAFENTFYVSGSNEIFEYNLSAYPYSLKNIYNLSQIREAFLTNCYKIYTTPIQGILIASCYVYPAQNSMYPTIYLFVINLNDLPNSTLVPQTYLAASIEVADQQPCPLIYVYNLQCIDIYELQPANSTYTLVWISNINSEEIGVSMLQINSIMYLNQTDIILSDISSGFLWIKASISNRNKISYELYGQYTFPSRFIDDKSYYTSAALLSDQKTILATENNGKALLINICDAGLIAKSEFPQLADETNEWMYSLYVYEPQTLALYPISNSTFLWIRVLNYSESFDNCVYTDIPIGTDLNYFGQLKIFVTQETAVSLRFILLLQYTNSIQYSIILGEIRLSPIATFAPIEGFSAKTLKLVGYIDESGSQEAVGKFGLQWGKSKGEEKTSSHLDWYSRWYVWVSIIGGITLVVVALIIAIKKRRKRRRLVSISLLSIDKQYRYSISDL